MNSKYNNFLTVILILIIVAIVGIIGFLGFRYYKASSDKNKSDKFVDNFLDQSQNNDKDNNSSLLPSEDNNDNMFDGVDGKDNTNNSGTSGSDNRQRYNGFLISGTIEIPATGLKSPVIAASEYSPKALETAVSELYGVGLNQVGNTTIMGHNYRDGRFFANNKKLQVGDKIYITDLTGKRLSYTIYDKFETEENDSDYMSRDTQNAIEISLSTCTDNSKKRLIILAKADV